MAIDTRNKRQSACSGALFNIHYPVPDGSIGKSDRAHIAGFYSGIEIAMVLNTFRAQLNLLKDQNQLKLLKDQNQLKYIN